MSSTPRFNAHTREVAYLAARTSTMAALRPSLVAFLVSSLSYRDTKALYHISMGSMSLPETMKAVIYGEDSPQLVTRPLPRVSSQNVMIRVVAAGLNPVDAKNVIGDKLPASWTRTRDFIRRKIAQNIIGFEFAGIVVEPSGGYKEGDAVFGSVPPFTGTLAEYIVAPLDQVCYKPRNLSWEEAAALPLVGLTALQCLHPLLDVKSRLVIVGASGGTGHVAIQVAKALGAHVTAVCSDGNREFCRSLGANVVVDYALASFWDDLATAGPFSTVMDCVTSADPRDSSYQYPQRIQQQPNLLTPDYQYRRLGGESPDWIRAGLLRFGINCWTGRERLFWIRFPKSQNDLRQLQQWAEGNQLKPHISQVYKLDKAKEALDALLQRRVQGKVVVRIAADDLE